MNSIPEPHAPVVGKVVPRLRAGPITFLSYGFRPFFLGASMWAALAMLLWVGLVTGAWRFASSYGFVAWHAHEMLLGYGSAVVTGFLLTAIPNWTGRLPVQGGPLLALFLLWVAGRIALLASDQIGVPAAIAVDVTYLPVLASVILREIIAGKNWRNLKVVALIFMLACGNAVFHGETALNGAPDYGVRIALAAIVGMIMLIGGRITPSFTHNWLMQRQSKTLPASFDRFDVMALATSAVALLAWVIEPGAAQAGYLAAIAAAVQFARLARWAGIYTWREPLVLILHAGYFFVPLGFAAVAVSIWRPDILQPSDALHAWTTGAVGIMTLAVMTRATLGHTGRAITANAATLLIYLTIVIAAMSRLCAALLFEGRTTAVEVSGGLWIAAYAVFVLTYGPMLLTARRSRRI